MKQNVQSFDRCVDILEFLAENDTSVSLKEISNKVGLPSSTVHNLLSTMVNRGYVTHVGQRKGFTLGPAIQSLSVKMNDRIVSTIAQPFLEKLSNLTGESLYVGLFKNYRIIPHMFVKSLNFLSTGPVGVETDLHALAQGKVLLATWSKKELDEWIEFYGLRKCTDYTITDRDLLIEKLKEVREKGYAVAFEEKTPGAIAIAAGIYDKSGKLFASLAVGMPTARATPQNMELELVVELVKNIANEISHEIKLRN